MKRIIVNASGAKHGGAKTIVESYCRWLEKNNTDYEYIFIVGFNLITTNKNIKVINFSTTGLSSLIFSSIGVAALCIAYRTNTIISFMNTNLIFPGFKKVTYFHQALFFSEKILKFRIYGWLLKLQTSSYYVCQNENIERNLHKFFQNSERVKIESIWPGTLIPERTIEPKWYTGIVSSTDNVAVCPYSSLIFSYKNFDKIYNSYDFFKKNNMKVIVTADKYIYENNDVFHFVGNCTSSELHFLYKQADAVLFPSKNETVGLPIFEAMYHGTPVVVEDVEYVHTLKSKFPYLDFNIETNNTYSFDLASLKNKELNPNSTCFIGDWGRIVNLFDALS